LDNPHETWELNALLLFPAFYPWQFFNSPASIYFQTEILIFSENFENTKITISFTS